MQDGIAGYEVRKNSHVIAGRPAKAVFLHKSPRHASDCGWATSQAILVLPSGGEQRSGGVRSHAVRCHGRPAMMFREKRCKRMNSRFDEALLEHRLRHADFERLKKICTAGWPEDVVASSSRGVEDVVFRRHDNTVRFAVPWIARHLDLPDTHIIDFGAGCGSSSLALSHFARSVTGLEIDAHYVAAFGERMRVFGVDNTRIIHSSPELILDECVRCMTPQTSVVLLAVVEHLLELEQVSYLQRMWQALSPGQCLIVMETPNLYAFYDGHTFERPFTHLIPDALFLTWLRSRSAVGLRFRDALLATAEQQGEQAVLHQRRRLGRGVSHHCFELAFDCDLSEIVVADGFCENIVDWFPVFPDDRMLLGFFRDREIELPIGFARSVLAFMFRKPDSAADARKVREWNRQHRNYVLSRYLDATPG